MFQVEQLNVKLIQYKDYQIYVEKVKEHEITIRNLRAQLLEQKKTITELNITIVTITEEIKDLRNRKPEV